MGKQVKDDYLGGRTSKEHKTKVLAYLEQSDMTQGEFIRRASDEYMANHPIKKPQPAPSEVKKPGE